MSKPVLGPSRLLFNRYWSLVSLVWMYELHLQVPCVLVSWNTICKLRSHHPVHDLTSISHKSHNTISGSVTFIVMWNWRTAIWEWSNKQLCQTWKCCYSEQKEQHYKQRIWSTGNIVCVGRGASIYKVWFQTPVGKGLLGRAHAS